jgi:hypothetical protein
LQGLEIMTRGEQAIVWIKAVALREQVARLMGQPVERMGDAQWIGHILKRLQLTDRNRRKAYSGGQMYSIKRAEVLDMMRRYEIDLVAPEN